MLLGYKAICLATDLSATDKAVAGVLLDHFNKRTGQCDPSLDRIAKLLDVSPRTVIRSINRLVKARFFARLRHGGHFNRNSYCPIWAFHHERERVWRQRFASNARARATSTLSSDRGQGCQVAGDVGVTQTYSQNPLKQPTQQPHNFDPRAYQAEKSKWLSNEGKEETWQRGKGVPSDIFMRKDEDDKQQRRGRTDAERRWSKDLNDLFVKDTNLYARVISAIDLQMQRDATMAEQQSPGTGIRVILDRLGAVAGLMADVLEPDGDRG